MRLPSPCPQDPGTGNTEESSCERLSHWPGRTRLPPLELGSTSADTASPHTGGLGTLQADEHFSVTCKPVLPCTRFSVRPSLWPWEGRSTHSTNPSCKTQAARRRLQFKGTRKRGVHPRKGRTSLVGTQPRKVFGVGPPKGRKSHATESGDLGPAHTFASVVSDALLRAGHCLKHCTYVNSLDPHDRRGTTAALWELTPREEGPRPRSHSKYGAELGLKPTQSALEPVFLTVTLTVDFGSPD